MLSKRTLQFARAIPRIQQVRRMGGGHGVPAHFKPIRQICEENKSHMNCMPVPQGSWQEHYNARNNKWNMMLAASALSVALTYVALWKCGCIYFHGPPPCYTNRKK